MDNYPKLEEMMMLSSAGTPYLSASATEGAGFGSGEPGEQYDHITGGKSISLVYCCMELLYCIVLYCMIDCILQLAECMAWNSLYIMHSNAWSLFVFSWQLLIQFQLQENTLDMLNMLFEWDMSTYIDVSIF